MRRYLTIAILAAVIVTAGVLTAVLTAGATTPSTTATSTPVTSPLAVLQAAANQARGVQSGAGTFDLKITATPSSSASAMLQTILAKPIELSGTVGVDASQKAADITLSVSSSVFSPTFELRWLNGKGWLEYNNTWYDLPPQLLHKIAAEKAKHESHAPAHVRAQKLGIDPASWVSNLTLVSTNGTADVGMDFNVAQIARDLIHVVKSPGFFRMFSGHLKAAQVAELKKGLTDARLADLPTQAAAIIVNPHVDVFVDTQSNQFKQVHLKFTVVPPAAAKVPIDSAAVDFTGTVTQLGQSVSVTAPTSTQPFSQLQKSFGGLQKLFKSMP
jgi:hypothetical protein